MGLANSKNSTDILNEVMTNVLMQNSMNCTQSIDTTQIIQMKNLKFSGCDTTSITDISQTANLSPNLKCAQQSSNSADLMNKIKDEIKQKAESVIKNIPVASETKAENITKLTDLVQTNIDIVNIVTCAQNTIARQIIELQNIEVNCPPGGKATVSGITQSIISNAVVDCNAKNDNTVKVTNDMQAIIDQSAKAEIDGWDPLGFLGTIGIAIVAAVLILAVLKLILGKGKDEQKKDSVEMMPGYGYMPYYMFPPMIPPVPPVPPVAQAGATTTTPSFGGSGRGRRVKLNW